MGQRLYNPNTGRFLQVDPVPGGSANNYDYADQDPINNSDLNGEWCWRHCHWSVYPFGRHGGRGGRGRRIGLGLMSIAFSIIHPFYEHIDGSRLHPPGIEGRRPKEYGDPLDPQEPQRFRHFGRFFPPPPVFWFPVLLFA
jgi:hypothetical protein